MTDNQERPWKPTAEILEAAVPREEDVWVEEWGSMVRVRALTVSQQSRLQKMQREGATVNEQELELVVMACRDAGGKPLFKPTDKQRLMAQAPAAVDTIWRAVHRLMSGKDGKPQTAEGVEAD